MTFSFDPADPLECARAERVVKDMLKRGYLLFAKVDDKYARVTEFDDKRHEYVIADGPDPSVLQEARYTAPAAEAVQEPEPDPVKRPEATAERQAEKKIDQVLGKRGRKGRRVPARGTAVTGIAPTAGG